MTRKAKRAVAITMLSIILIGLAFCISALAVSSVNGTTFTATVTEWWGVVVKAFSPSTDKPGVDKPDTDKPGEDKPGEDNSGTDNPDTDKPGEGTTAVCYDENGNLLKSGVRYAFQNSLNFAEARGASNPTGGITITASIIPASALDKRVNWSVEWVDSSSEWAKGKTVTDYVTVTADTTDSRIATVNCLAPFGSQIKVVATSVANAEAKASCYVDYYKKGEDIEMTIERAWVRGPQNQDLVATNEENILLTNLFKRIGKNEYSMKFDKIATLNIQGTRLFGFRYIEEYKDNSIGTKDGLRDISLIKGELTAEFKNKLSKISAPTDNLFFGAVRNIRMDLEEHDKKMRVGGFVKKGPTIDSLNLKACFGVDSIDSNNYEPIAQAIIDIKNEGKYHYNYTLMAFDVLTGEKKEITIKVRLDDSFIPEPRGVELDNGNIGF